MLFEIVAGAFVSVSLLNPLTVLIAQQKIAATTTQSEASASKDSPRSADLVDVEKELIEKTNAERARYGLPPLVIDRNLERTTRTHAAWMTNNHTLQHTSGNVGENIAMGQPTTDRAVSDWMNSPGHRANILSASYTRTGVAGYRAADGTTYWCQQFLP